MSARSPGGTAVGMSPSRFRYAGPTENPFACELCGVKRQGYGIGFRCSERGCTEGHHLCLGCWNLACIWRLQTLVPTRCPKTFTEAEQTLAVLQRLR